MKPPRLTKKVVRGLWDIATIIDAELDSGEEGYFGSARQGGPSDKGDAAASALRYIRALAEWYEAKKKK